MSELNDGKGADVSTDLMPLIKFLNKMGVTTVSSREGGEFAPIQVRMVGTPENLVDVLFRQIQPMIVHMEQSHVQITYVDGAWVGTVSVKLSDLHDLTQRVGCWLEMLHK
jgi:hypothetical protein